MKNLAFASIAQLRQQLDNKEITEQELLKFYLDRFNQYNPTLNAAIEVFDTESIEGQFSQKGILSGIPGLIKDNILQNDIL